MLDNGRVISVVYLRRPPGAVAATAAAAAPSGAYLAIRQGSHNVAEDGTKESLKFQVEDAPELLEGSPLRVVAMAPPVVPGMFGLKGLAEFGIALLLIIGAIALVLLARRRGAAPAVEKDIEDEEPGELTLAELQSAGKIVAPAAAKVILTTSERPAAPGIALSRSIFRAYDIRGIVGQTLDANIARLLGQAIGSVMNERNQKSIVVGRDGRLSSASISARCRRIAQGAGSD